MEDRLLLAGWTTYAGNSQHTALSTVASQSLEVLHWTTPVDVTPPSGIILIHYGSPLVTPSNTVILPVKTGSSGGFKMQAINGKDGGLVWSYTTNYLLPPYSWMPSYSPTLTASNRLYFADAGGTVRYRTDADSAASTTSAQIPFYGTLDTYNLHKSDYDNNVFINTPITSDSAGNIYFGFRVKSDAPATIGNLKSGIARIDPNGNGSWTSAIDASGGDSSITKVPHQAAPALSNDGQTLYAVVVSDNTSTGRYLVGLDPTTLALKESSPGVKMRVALKDPRSGGSNGASISDNSSATPMVGPDGDVYYGILGNPGNGSRGWMLHYSADLSRTKTPGAFGWDSTASVVPASMVPSYHGSSSYLIFTKYNNYAGLDGGDGVNKVAILDPNDTMVESHASSNGLLVMKEILTIAGPTPDPDHLTNFPNAVREWCINSAAVDLFTKSVLVNSEDGKLYRWDLASNTLSQATTLSAGIGEAYTPTVVGPDGTVYAINYSILNAVGRKPTISINDVSVVEGNSGTTTATFTVSLSSGSTEPISVDYSTSNGTANGSDFSSSSGSLSYVPFTTILAPGETSKTIAITVTGDTSLEPDETFFVNLSNPTNATLSDNQGVGTILNDDVVWDGEGSSSNWSEAKNWSNDTVPQAGSAVTFNGTSTRNSTVDPAFAGVVNQLVIETTYTGTITAARPVNFGALSGAGGLVALADNTVTVGAANLHSTFGGTIGGASGGFTKVGTGSFYQSGNNTYDGVTTILDGSVLVSANNALGTATGGTVVAAGATARLVFERGVNYSTAEPVTIHGSGFNGAGSLVGTGNSAFAGPITLGADSTIGAYPANYAFTLGGGISTAGNVLTVKGSGNAAIAGVVNGGGGVIKDGSGTATFSNINSYTGTTSVMAGTLSVSGSIATSAVTVNPGAVLGGTGTVGPMTVVGGTVSPGISIGILSGSAADFSSSGALRIQVQGYATAGSDFDRLNLSGSLTTGGTSKLTLDLAGLSSTGTVAGIVSYGSRSGAFATVDFVNNPNNYKACLTYGETALIVSIQTGACFQSISAGIDTQPILISDLLTGAGRVLGGSSRPVPVASLDSGVDYTHPGVAQNIWINQDEIPAAVREKLRDYDHDGKITWRDLNKKANQRRGHITDSNGNGLLDGGDLLHAWSNASDEDGNGYVDDLIGWDFVNNDNDPMDDSGHGTHSASTLVQVAHRAEIVPLKFLDTNAVGSLSDAVRALDYALAKNVPISSNGWSASVFSQEWLDELEKAKLAGHLFVTAAGNGDPALLRTLGQLHLANVVVVAATDVTGRLAQFSNWDSAIVDLMAPGVGVVSAIPGGQYEAISGTSVSTALAAGAAAVLEGTRPKLQHGNLDDVRHQLTTILDKLFSQHAPGSN